MHVEMRQPVSPDGDTMCWDCSDGLPYRFFRHEGLRRSAGVAIDTTTGWSALEDPREDPRRLIGC
ncbi:Hsp70-interacting protein Hip [Giardia duodenalis]|uniref:Hsp70-interacting protein Hip n=1 Tax=Giardia intestinalis TaxID=5741 RepID=V6TFI4_GIAIN|nr:Hsp70-interacting protein Hip [Giardia intestinalis]